MKNVTISLDEAVARWARIAAAKEEMSLSAYIARLLTERMKGEADYEAAMGRSLARDPLPLGWRKQLGSRDEIYDRPVLRR